MVEKCQQFRNAESEIKELSIRLEGSWIRIKYQLRLVERIAHTLDEEHCRVQDEVLQLLAAKLSLAQTKIDKVVKKTSPKASYLSIVTVRRWKLVLQRDVLNKVISDLEQWQARFDPSWFLIIRIANPVIDQELAAQKVEQEQAKDGNLDQLQSSTAPIAIATAMRDALRPEPREHKPTFLPVVELTKIDIPFSNAKVAQQGGKWFIIERYACQTGRPLSTQNDDVRTLARKLGCTDPWTFGLLNCKGVMKVIHPVRHQILGFDFVFRVPDSMDSLRSLRQDLLSGELNHSLSRRLLMAQDLAKSVSYIHNLKFVHKNVNPEAILLFEDSKARFSTFLVGFDNFRSADGGTNLVGDARWERNLYRHPSRQGEFPDEEYKMHHDVYSLGVCLLEIGLWQSFVSYSSDGKLTPEYGDAYKQFMKWLESTTTPAIQPTTRLAYQSIMSFKLKEYFIHLANTRLPITMGDKYSAVVVTCLTCLDENNENFDNEIQAHDEEEILVAVRFIETTLLKLNEISV